jgi:hypothetical protein
MGHQWKGEIDNQRGQNFWDTRLLWANSRRPYCLDSMVSEWLSRSIDSTTHRLDLSIHCSIEFSTISIFRFTSASVNLKNLTPKDSKRSCLMSSLIFASSPPLTATIDLNRQLQILAIEIDNISIDWTLPIEIITPHLLPFQALPQQHLTQSHILS